MDRELVFETRHHHRVVRADSLHAALGVTTNLRLWVMMHTAAGDARDGVDVFHDGSPLTAAWSLAFAAEVALLEYDPDLASLLHAAQASLDA